MAEPACPRQDVGPYVLGLLTDEEAAVFEEHVSGCSACWRQVADLAHLPSLLEIAAPSRPAPPSLEARTFARLERARRRRIGTLAAAASLALALVVLVALPRSAPPTFEAALTAPAGAPAPDASGSVHVWATESGLAIELEVRDLPVPPPGHHYECWYVTTDDHAPARVTGGTFTVEADGRAALTMHSAADPRRYPGILITLEPDDGDPTPKGPVVLAFAPPAPAGHPPAMGNAQW